MLTLHQQKTSYIELDGSFYNGKIRVSINKGKP